MRRLRAIALAAGLCAGCAHAPEGPPSAAPAADGWSGPGLPLSTWAMRPDDVVAPAARPDAHIVAPGETLYAIAMRYQAPLRALIEANRLDPPFRLATGQAVKLPPPITYRVAAGDTLSELAARFGVDRRSLALLNRLNEPDALEAGQVLVLPAAARVPSGGRRPPSPPPPARRAERPKLASTPNATLLWPADGPLVTPFGRLADGRRSDGVDIRAPAGAAVRAVAPGVVAYAGTDLLGYGALVLIQHDDEFVSAYARLGRIDVREGARVAAGAAVGAAGPSPVHFQLRRGGAPTDPRAALPPRA